MTERSEHAADLDDLAERVRQRHEEALQPMPPRPQGCSVCSGLRLRPGEHRDGRHVSTCPLAGVPAPRAEG